MTAANQLLANSINLLRIKTSKYALQGTLIGVAATILATIVVGYYQSGSVSVGGMIQAQAGNAALWVLDLTPFAFAFWGQYVNAMMAYEAGVLVFDQTNELRTQTAALEFEVLRRVTYDSLTDLPNRVLLLDRLQQALSTAHQEKMLLALMILDLADFNEINNTLGRHQGDVLLKQVASRLRGAVREPNTVARIGADEFAVLLPKIREVNDVRHMAARLHKAMEPSFVLESMSLDVMVDIGITHYPEHGDDVDTLMQRAEVALEVAKRESGAAVIIYSPELDQYNPRRLTLMGELRRAIEGGRLVLHYQPKVDIATGQIKEVEALVRWQHPEHGLVRPEEFIPLAERTGLIRPLTHWVLNEALRQCATWQKNGLSIGVAVNVSARVMLDPELPDLMAGLLASAGVGPSWLVVEITESTIMADQQRALEIVSRLAQMGVRISIDDFGTGYSSLAYLSKLPVNELKIDKSFVEDMLENANNEAIVRATIGLAHSLGLSVIAEGVHNEAIVEHLRQLHCDLVQGYYISSPMSTDELTDWARSFSWSSAAQGRPAASA